MESPASETENKQTKYRKYEQIIGRYIVKFEKILYNLNYLHTSMQADMTAYIRS